ncbi:hypothetical protein HBI17_203050 [Parastagonospora nodorum]|nr:hypothetical protein HBI17_203050 [Parastagonospora nodorum]
MAPSISDEYGELSLDRSDIKNPTSCNGYHEDARTAASYEVSPYQDTKIVSILVGRDALPFTIHSAVIAQSEVLAAKVSYKRNGNQVLALDLDNSTAHTLIGFMYTGTYNELPLSSELTRSAMSVYETGTCVYCAAVRYQLAGLVELAKEKIMSSDEGVSISDILRIAKEQAFPLLPGNETWYPSYLEAAIKRAMAKDPEPFKRPDFITQVEGNSRLLQMVWKTVISNYAGVVSAPTTGGGDMPPMDHEQEKSEDVLTFQSRPPASVDGSQTTAVANDTPADPPSPEKSYYTTASAATSVENSLKLDDIEPTIGYHQVPEPFTDELDFKKSTTFQKMNKNESVAIKSAVAPSDQARSAHKRSDSVLQAEDAAAKETDDVAEESVEKAESADKLGDSSPLVADGSFDATTASKKAKKKKKGGKPSTVF